MASLLRLMLPFAAAVAVASVLSTAMPAIGRWIQMWRWRIRRAAAQGPRLPASGSSGCATNAVAASRDHRRDRYVRATRDLDCSGAWCGRQFVLMIGIGY